MISTLKRAVRRLTATRPPLDLDEEVHNRYVAGRLSSLGAHQVDTVLHCLHQAGVLTLRAIPDDTLFANIRMRLDTLLHHLSLTGRLADLTVGQIETIVLAFQQAGHEQCISTTTASYNQSHLVTWSSAEALKEPRFREAYRVGRETDSWQGYEVEWRVHVVCWAATQATRLEGDFVECGVNRGGYSRAVCSYLGFEKLPRRFYLLDTYCGVPPDLREKAATVDSRYGECYEEVRQTFAAYPNVTLVRGRVPDTLAQVPSDKVAYLSIDMNCAEPEIAAGEYFWPKLVPGAVIVLDDYAAGPWYEAQRVAWDRFAREHGVEVLSLPTSQGLIIKH